MPLKPLFYSFAAAFALAACATQPVQTNANAGGAGDLAPEQGTGRTAQQLVHAKDFMAASANPLATEAGYEVLKRGGSAIDAMIAMQTTLSLVEPQSSGLGGGAFLVYWDNQAKKLTTFDARETAPQGATPQLFLDSDGQPLKFMDAVVGGRSVGTPGIPKLLEDVHKRYGKLAWAGLFDYPVKLAEEGFKVSPRMAASIVQNEQYLRRYPATAAYFLPGGKPLAAGTLLKNPEFAQSVRLLAKEGSAPFYSGRPAQNMVAAVKSAADNSGTLSLADFQKYRVIERAPVCKPYREYEICGMGAPSSGGLALGQIFGILQQHDMQASGADNLQSWRWLGEASRVAFADRDYYVGDPDFVAVPARAMLADAYLKQRAAEIAATDKAQENIKAGEFKQGLSQGKPIELPSTSHIVIVDKDGNVVSMTTSIENAFGSTLMANGYLLNNELTDFAFNPADQGRQVANSAAPGKRPRSSMAPTIVLKNGAPYLAVGSPGGSRIIGYVAKTLVAHIDWGMNIQQAIDLPNMLNRGSAYEVEEHTAAADFAPGLGQMGYKVQIRDLNSGVQGIVIRSDGLEGGADPRREGKVMGD
ncbi:MAG: gamma-glutamyltransferase [Neisseria sp.]|nr:gamma-glutamyltransferase [Neisseria sp.]